MGELADNLINPRAAKLALLALMRNSTATEMVLIQAYLNNVDSVAPEDKRITASKLPSLLSSKGRLTRLYSQVVANVAEILHRGGKPEYKQQPKFNLTTGEMTVDAPSDVPAS